MGLIGDLFTGFSAAKAARSAAKAQQGGAQQAQALELQNQEKAQNFQQGVYDTTKANEQPYVAAGAQSVNNLAKLANDPNYSTYGQTFQAPTLDQARAMPGYQFALGAGSDAIAKESAATGNLMSGNTGVELQKYGQGLADTDYGQLYNQALGTYMTNYNVWNNDTTNRFNREAQVAGMGQTAVGQEGQLGQEASNTMANVDLTGGAQQAQQINNAAAARASGYIGSANAYNHMVNNIGNGIMGSQMLFQS